MNKILLSFSALMLTSGAAFAELPDPSILDGHCGADLKAIVKRTYYPVEIMSYGEDTWDVFKTADVRMIDGKPAWYDMYSNRIVYVEQGHPGMNIEHAVANSWWGGVKNDAYKDCYHLNPSDADANVRKSNNPLGIIEGTPTWSNGLTRIGRPTATTGGGASTVFEPADEYKGDFARAYFYIFTIYDDISWAEAPACMYDLSAYPTLKPWAYEMLLKWAADDPVDEREMQRNNAVTMWQFNENPFITYPELAEHIWGDKKNVPFKVEFAHPLPDRPEAPTYGDYYLAGVNTWTGRWWNAFTLNLAAPEGCDIFYSLNDGEDYKSYENGIVIGGASKAGEVVTVNAYAVRKDDVLNRRSSISSLTLTAAEDGATDYMHATWSLVTSASEISTDNQYVIVSSDVNAVMSVNAAATSSSGYYSVSGNATPNDSHEINYLPEGSAVITLSEAGGCQYYLGVNSLSLEHKGFVSATAAKKLTMSDEGMPVAITVNDDGTTTLDLGSTYGTIQYNSSSPRFSVYTSKQKPVNLYRCTSGGSMAVEALEAISRDSERIFSLDGTEIFGGRSSLPAGVYIILKGNKATKLLKR